MVRQRSQARYQHDIKGPCPISRGPEESGKHTRSIFQADAETGQKEREGQNQEMKVAMLIKISIFAGLTFLTWKESGPWTASTLVFLFLYIEAVGKTTQIITTKIADILKDLTRRFY